MDPRHLFLDERLRKVCVYCGAEPDTHDHVPSKVLLDEPFPPQLPVVNACERCNSSFSLHEQFLACFLECVLVGTTELSAIRRDKIRRILTENSSLGTRISASRRDDGMGNLLWQTDDDRIRKVMLKLARGHVAYELYPKLEEPRELVVVPLPSLTELERTAFEDTHISDASVWGELGNRSFLRAAGKKPDQFERVGDWIVVQPGRYRYAVVETGGPLVRLVLSEYLACQVVWE